jgi:hypothetical protein
MTGCSVLNDQIKRNFEHVGDFFQSCGCPFSPSVFQIGNVTLSNLSLMREIELRFSAPLAEHAQRILAASDDHCAQGDTAERRTLSRAARGLTFSALTRRLPNAAGYVVTHADQFDSAEAA